MLDLFSTDCRSAQDLTFVNVLHGRSDHQKEGQACAAFVGFYGLLRVFGGQERAALANERRANPADMDIFRLQMENWLRQARGDGVAPTTWGALDVAVNGFVPPPRKRRMVSRLGFERDAEIFLRELPGASAAGAGGDGDVDMSAAPVDLTVSGESRDRIRAIKALAPSVESRTQLQMVPARRGLGRDQDEDMPSASAAAGNGGGKGRTRPRQPHMSSGARRRKKWKRIAKEMQASGDT